MLKSINKLIFMNIRRNLRTSFSGSLGIIIGVAFLVFFIGLGFGVKRIIFQKYFAALPVGTIEVTPRSLDFGILRFGRPKILGGGDITDETLDEFRNIGGVKKVTPVMVINAPLQARGEFFGNRLTTDLAATGIASEMAAGDIGAGKSFTYKKGEKVPVIVSEQLLSLYNTTLAPQMKLPQINPESPPKLEFNLVVGRSYLQGAPDSSKVETYKAAVVGVSKHAIVLGVTVPLEFARAVNNKFGQKSAVYKTAFVSAAPEKLREVTSHIERMGYAIDRDRKIVASLIYYSVALFSLFAVMLLLLSAINVYHISYMQIFLRRRELGVFRALGATRADIRALVVGEAFYTGLFAGVCGVLIGGVAALILELALQNALKGLPFESADIFYFHWWLRPLAILIAVLFSVAGAFQPARKAAAMQPAKALSDA